MIQGDTFPHDNCSNTQWNLAGLVNMRQPVICCVILFFFQPPLFWWNTFCLLYCYGSHFQLFAIQMPLFKNGYNNLEFQNKSEFQEFEPFNSLVENTKMCYIIVTTWLHSLLVFAKEGILLEFCTVRHCKPGKCCYIHVTFLDCLNRSCD